MERNPAYRYAAVPVELPRGSLKKVVYIVRMRNRDQAIKRVANTVDPESLIDLNETRTFDTKKAAEAYGKEKLKLHAVYLDATKPMKGEAPKAPAVQVAEAPAERVPPKKAPPKKAPPRKVANPDLRTLKNKLLR